MAHLAGGVHAGVGAPGDGQPGRAVRRRRSGPAPRRGRRRRYAARAGRPSRRSPCRRSRTSSRTRTRRDRDRRPRSARLGTASDVRAGVRRRGDQASSARPRRPASAAVVGRLAASAGVRRLGGSSASSVVAGERGHRVGLARPCGRPPWPPWPAARLDHDQLLDQLDDRHRRGVALARAGLHDPGVAAVAVGVPRRDLVEQRVHHVLVPDRRSAPAGARAGHRAWPW